MMVKNVLLKTFGENIKQIIQSLKEDFLEKVEEIHIRVEKPLLIFAQNKEYFVKEDGSITNKVVENGTIKTIQNISALNVRISHQVKGCSDIVLQYVIENKIFYNTLLISPPACGKTTLLRDMVRQLSNGKEGFFEGQTVGVADERGEIAGCYKGIAQNDVGIRTDVLDCCPKAEGMLMLVRSMSPRIIAVDEIGKKEDFVAIESIVNAGIQLLCTVHGNDLEDVKRRAILGDMIKNGVFHSIVVLSAKKRVGEIKTIYNKNLEIVYKA